MIQLNYLLASEFFGGELFEKFTAVAHLAIGGRLLHNFVPLEETN